MLVGSKMAIQFERIQDVTYPSSGFEGKDKQQLNDLFRWFVVYRHATNDMLPRPHGSLYETMLLLDLIQAAWFDYCIRDDVRDLIHQTFTATFVGGFAEMTQRLKSKVWALYLKEKYGSDTPINNKHHAQNYPHALTILAARPATIEKGQTKVAQMSMPLPPGLPSEWELPLNAVYRWFVMYRELSGDYVPPPSGTRCEIVWMCELVKAAFLDLHFDIAKQEWLSCFELPYADRVPAWAEQLRLVALHHHVA